MIPAQSPGQSAWVGYMHGTQARRYHDPHLSSCKPGTIAGAGQAHRLCYGRCLQCRMLQWAMFCGRLCNPCSLANGFGRLWPLSTMTGNGRVTQAARPVVRALSGTELLVTIVSAEQRQYIRMGPPHQTHRRTWQPKGSLCCDVHDWHKGGSLRYIEALLRIIHEALAQLRDSENVLAPAACIHKGFVSRLRIMVQRDATIGRCVERSDPVASCLM